MPIISTAASVLASGILVSEWLRLLVPISN